MYRLFKVVFVDVSNAAIVIGFGIIWLQFYGPVVIFDSPLVIALFLISKAIKKFCIGPLMDVLKFNKSVQVIVDGFCRYAMIFSQMIQYRPFKVFWDADYIVWLRLNKAFLRLNKYALLSNDAIGRILRWSNRLVLIA